jgi:hypothetical protein
MHLVWKEFAKQTLIWQKNVIRVAAVDCALTENTELCRFHGINSFPTFYMFELHSQKYKGTKVNYYSYEQDFKHELIDFLQIHPIKPSFWPLFLIYE